MKIDTNAAMNRSLSYAVVLCLAWVGSSAANVQPGDILITEFFEGWHRIDPATNVVTPLSFPESDASLLAADGAGSVFFSDGLDTVSRLNLASGGVTDVTVEAFDFVQGLVVASTGDLIVADTDSVVRFPFDSAGSVSTIVTDTFFGPAGIAQSSDGRLFITEFFDDLLEVLPASGQVTPVTSADLELASLITVDPTGDLIVLDFENNLLRIDPDSGSVNIFSSDLPQFPAAIATDAAGDVLMTSTEGIFRFDGSTGERSLIASGTFFSPSGIVVIPEAAAAPGDFDGDGSIDADDYGTWASSFGSTTNLAADANGNGVVDAGDYTVWRDATSVAVTAVPEASSILLVCLATPSHALLRRRPYTDTRIQ